MGIENYEIGAAFMTSPPSTFFRGTNVILGSEVILRRLAIDAARAPDVRETFYREQRLAARLRHPHIQRPLDVFEHDESLWSVHDFDRIRLTHDLVREEGPLPVGEAARLGSQTADAIAHMHAEGYVHGKLSPRWITVSQRGEALILNLVKASDLHAGVWPLRPAVLGLSPYTAPEEFAGEKPTPKSDVYALAGTVFTWLTGEYPRGGSGEEEGTQRACEGSPVLDLRVLCPTVPTALADFLEGALESDPAKRRGSAASLGMLLLEIHQRHAAELPSGFQTGARLFPQGCPAGLEIVGRHGAGAFGVVLRATSSCGDDVPLAVKALKPEHREDQDALERFLREARAMQQIDHPNVVAIRGVGEEHGTPYAVMDFIGGPDLATLLLREGGLPWQRAVYLGVGIARGLAAIHAAGIVHRDLKPHNILVTEDDRAVIADFGIARQDTATRLTLTGQLAGTPLYMAPEQFAGAVATPAADLYALGTILYELMSGSLPYPNSESIYAITAVRQSPPAELPETIPPKGPSASNLCPRIPLSGHLRQRLPRAFLNVDRLRLRIRSVAADESDPSLGAIPTGCLRPAPKLRELAQQLLCADPDRRPSDAAGVAETLESLLEEAPVD